MAMHVRSGNKHLTGHLIPCPIPRAPRSPGWRMALAMTLRSQRLVSSQMPRASHGLVSRGVLLPKEGEGAVDAAAVGVVVRLMDHKALADKLQGLSIIRIMHVDGP